MKKLTLNTIGRLIRPILSLVIMTSAGCVEHLQWECHHTSDCAAEEFCRLSRCTPLESLETEAQGTSQDDTPKGDPTTAADASGADDSPDIEDSPAPGCPEGELPAPGDLVINEVLANPPSGPEGDANGDGVRDAFDDEFVEIVNISGHTLDISGVRIRVDGRDKFSFPITCLEDLRAAVVFGGGDPNPSQDFLVLTTSSRLSLSNAGGTISIVAEDGEVLRNMSYEKAKPVSLTLSPELHGAQYVEHTTLNEGALFSPGVCASGAQFKEGCEEEEDEKDEEVEGEEKEESSDEESASDQSD